MTYDQKIAEEWNILEKFRRSFADFPRGRVIKSESPDFIVNTSRKKSIGIEITWLPGPLNGVSIEEAIARKEGKLKLYYKQRLDHYWLILLTGPENGLNSQQTINMLERNHIPSIFHRVFLFNPHDERIFEIK